MLMDLPKNIRNMSVIAHVDHGGCTNMDKALSNQSCSMAWVVTSPLFFVCRKVYLDRLLGGCCRYYCYGKCKLESACMSGTAYLQAEDTVLLAFTMWGRTCKSWC